MDTIRCMIECEVKDYISIKEVLGSMNIVERAHAYGKNDLLLIFHCTEEQRQIIANNGINILIDSIIEVAW